MGVADARPLGVGEVLDAGIKVYLRNARTLMGLAATVVIPIQLLSGVVLLSIVTNSNQIPNTFTSFSTSTTTSNADSAAALGASVVLIVVSLIQSALTTAACVKAISNLYLGQPTDFGESLRFAARRLPAYAAMLVLYFLGLVLGLILLIIPGIWLYFAWAVSAPALLIEHRGPAGALRRSRALVKGRWGATAGVVLVALIMGTLVSGALQALLVGAAFIPGQPPVLLGVVVVTVAGALSAIVVTPFSASVSTILYYDLRARHEGYDLELLAEQLGLSADSLQSAATDAASSGSVSAPGFGPGARFAPPVAAHHPPPVGPESVGQPGGPPFWPPPPGWRPGA
jgi:hypothetical protein